MKIEKSQNVKAKSFDDLLHKARTGESILSSEVTELHVAWTGCPTGSLAFTLEEVFSQAEHWIKESPK